MDRRKPLPCDFPDLDLPAWNAALPFPNSYPADAMARKPVTPAAGPPPCVLGNTETFIVPVPANMRFVLSPRGVREIVRRRKEKP